MAVDGACVEGTVVRERRGTTTRLPMMPLSTSGRAAVGVCASVTMRLRFVEARTVSSNPTCKKQPLYPKSIQTTVMMKLRAVVQTL